MGEPWDQLGGLQSQLGGLQSQLGGPLSQLGGPQSQLGGPRGDGQTDERTNGRNFSPFYRTSSPTGAAAQKEEKD